MMSDTEYGRDPLGQALAVPVEPVARLDPSGFDHSRWYDLIERCERAQGRDPWLNRDIEVLLGRGRDCDDPTRQKDAYAMPLHRSDYYVPPEYTRSFDTALTLLHCDMHVNLHPYTDKNSGQRRWCVGLVRLYDDDDPQGWQGYGANPALALAAAALRSRKRAIATEAGTAETENTGSVHEGAGLQGIAQPQSVSGLSHTGVDRG